MCCVPRFRHTCCERPTPFLRPQDKATGVTKLVAANIGDARILLIKSGGKAPVQLTFDHVPDDETERKRIERFNPNPRSESLIGRGHSPTCGIYFTLHFLTTSISSPLS